MRVLLVADTDSPHTRRWASGLSEAGLDVILAGFSPVSVPGVETIDLGAARTRGRFLRAVPRLRRVLNTVQPDIVNAHFVSSYGVMTDLARPNVPVVMTAWGSDVLWLARRHPWHRQVVIRALQRADLVTYDSVDVSAIVRAVAPRTEQRRVLFGPERSWCTVARSDAPVVLSCRRPDGFYNVDVIVEAFARVHVRISEWVLEVLTYGLPVKELRHKVETLGIQEQVRFLPLLERDELMQKFASAAVFCSVPSSDAAAASLFEGMAAGSFPVVSDLESNREWVTNELNGLIVPPADVGALAHAFERAARDPDLRARACATNRGVIGSQCSWEASIEDVVASFQAIASRGCAAVV